MQIGIQLTPNGRRLDFDLIPDGEMWCLNPVGRRPVNRCNEAGLNAAFQLAGQAAERTAKERERELRRSLPGLAVAVSALPAHAVQKTARDIQRAALLFYSALMAVQNRSISSDVL